jgi:hypothetical protein
VSGRGQKGQDDRASGFRKKRADSRSLVCFVYLVYLVCLVGPLRGSGRCGQRLQATGFRPQASGFRRRGEESQQQLLRSSDQWLVISDQGKIRKGRGISREVSCVMWRYKIGPRGIVDFDKLLDFLYDYQCGVWTYGVLINP